MWDVLGIAPTTDGTAIRRAYAAKLRSIGGDRDPVAFVRLREAYEAALNWRNTVADPVVAARAADVVAVADNSFVFDPSGEPPADDGLADATIPPNAELSRLPIDDDDPTLDDFDRAIAGKSVIAAKRCLDRLMARGVIGLGGERAPALRLAELALHDVELPAATFAELVGHLGFSGDTQGDDHESRLRRKIAERLAADAWLVAQQNKAAERAWGKAREEVRIARAFVGTDRNRRLAGIRSGRLQKAIAEFHLHRSWIAQRVDLARIAAIEARFQRILQRQRRRKKIYAVLSWLFLASMVLDFIVILITGGLKQN